jgi:hypothetical protein
MPRMASPSHTIAASLRDRPALALAVLFAVVLSILAAATVVTGAGMDPARAVFYSAGPVLFTSVGAVILARLPGHPVGRIALGIGVLLAVSTLLVLAVTLVDPLGPVTVVLPGLAGQLLQATVVVAFALPALAMLLGGALLIIRFPDGRIESRAGRAAQTLVGIGVAAAFVGGLRDQILDILGYTPTIEALLGIASAVAFVGLIGAYLLALIDISLRYLEAVGLRRIQMRWVIAAVVIELALTVLAATVSNEIPGLWTIWIASSVLPIVAIAIGITRYRLYEIDRIISQTITYAALSVVLFIAFAGVNLLLQQVISPYTDGNAAATAISTLVVAALFTPARSRIQQAVDRRFHRAHYDAERTVERFASDLRQEVDLPTLRQALQSTAQQAVQPTSTAVWLRDRGAEA